MSSTFNAGVDSAILPATPQGSNIVLSPPGQSPFPETPSKDLTGKEKSKATTAGAQQVPPRQFSAVRLWFAFVLLVLVSLWLMTRNTVVSSYNFFIDGDRSADGANVLIDGKPAGKLTALPESGVKLMALRLSVADGAHDIEIRKPGFQTFHTRIQMSGEDYLAVHLQEAPGN